MWIWSNHTSTNVQNIWRIITVIDQYECREGAVDSILVASHYTKSIERSKTNAMDIRINEIYQEYETEWNDSIINILNESLFTQFMNYKHNYTERLRNYSNVILSSSNTLGTHKDPIYTEYMSLGLYIVWITLLRTLDIRVAYMLLQRTSIIFTQYLITYSDKKRQVQSVIFTIGDLIAFILKNLLGDIELPLKTNINNDQKQLLWYVIIKQYSKCKVEYE